MSHKYALHLLSWLLGPGYILENFLQLTDSYSVEDGSEPEHESGSEDPTFDPLQRARDISKLKESSDSNSDSDSERSSEFWDSSDAEKGSLSDDERGSLFDDEIGDGKTNENHQSENFEIANEKDDDEKKRHFKSSGGELHEDSKRFKLSTDESPNIDEIDITNDNKDEVSDGLISSTYKVLLFEDIINDRMEGVDDSRADMAGITAVP